MLTVPGRRSRAGLSGTRQDARQRRSPRDGRALTKRGRLFKVVTAGVALLLLAVVGSFVSWMVRPSSMSFGERSAEWLRSMPGGNWTVDTAEHLYYTLNAPRKGGPQLSKLPTVGVGAGSADRNRTGNARDTVARARAWPPPVEPIFRHPLPGEGVWKPTGPPLDGQAPVLVTTFRSETDYPRIVAYVAWFDHTRTALAFYPGRYEPPHTAVRGPMMVPDDQRSRLLATFNAGFIYSDGRNGSTDNGRVNEPLTPGNATLIGYRDGRVAITRWEGGRNAGPNVAWTRQSLTPIVWDGRINPALNTNPDSPRWGYTLGNAVRVWRTGVGVDRRGNLIFVAANDQTVISLAKILQHVGAVRAMEFDINPEWHTLITYRHRKRLVPTMVEPQPMQPASRYLVPDDRDFFAVYPREPGPISVPFQ